MWVWKEGSILFIMIMRLFPIRIIIYMIKNTPKRNPCRSGISEKPSKMKSTNVVWFHCGWVRHQTLLTCMTSKSFKIKCVVNIIWFQWIHVPSVWNEQNPLVKSHGFYCLSPVPLHLSQLLLISLYGTTIFPESHRVKIYYSRAGIQFQESECSIKKTFS